MVNQQLPDEIGSARPDRPRRELCNVLALSVLAAVTFRIIASLASGLVRIGTHAPALPPSGTRYVADVISWFADFGDGFGILLAATALGLVWWQVYSVPKVPSLEATNHSARSVFLCTWTSAVFAVTAVGSLAYAVAACITDWNDSERWLQIVGSAFYFSYCALGVIGFYATRQLLWKARLLAPDDGA